MTSEDEEGRSGNPTETAHEARDLTLNLDSTIALDQAIAAHCDAYAVLVETTEGRYRRRLMLSLHSAEKAVRRAEAAGHQAQMILVRITPVTGGDFSV